LGIKQQTRIAVLLPCYNEEAAIGATVEGFRQALPGATIYVYDNNSRDRTREVAAAAAPNVVNTWGTATGGSGGIPLKTWSMARTPS